MLAELGFYLWTKSQVTLTAFESGSINNLMLIGIALLDFLVLGRSFSGIQVFVILIVFKRNPLSAGQIKNEGEHGQGSFKGRSARGNSLTVMDFVRAGPWAEAA